MPVPALTGMYSPELSLDVGVAPPDPEQPERTNPATKGAHNDASRIFTLP